MDIKPGCLFVIYPDNAVVDVMFIETTNPTLVLVPNLGRRSTPDGAAMEQYHEPV